MLPVHVCLNICRDVLPDFDSHMHTHTSPLPCLNTLFPPTHSTLYITPKGLHLHTFTRLHIHALTHAHIYFPPPPLLTLPTYSPTRALRCAAPRTQKWREGRADCTSSTDPSSPSPSRRGTRTSHVGDLGNSERVPPRVERNAVGNNEKGGGGSEV